MISWKDLNTTQRAVLGAGAAMVAAAFVVLLSASDFDLSGIRTLKSVSASGGGTVFATQYNPVGIVGMALIALLILGALAAACFWGMRFMPTGAAAPGAGGADAKAVAKVGQKLDQEMASVLGHIRTHISTKETYAKSLANAQARLSNLSESEQVRVIVSLLIAENERMRQDSNTLRTRLEDSHQQIQSLRESLTQAQEFVLKDPLTGVGNRRQFDLTMAKAIADAQQKSSPLSVIMCDIDHFKRVNDAFGHQVGDELIKMFARVIESSIRDVDTAIRYGGEEFAVVLPATEVSAAKSVAERIRKQFEVKRITIRETNQKIGQLTASFGVAQFRSGDDIEALVQRADAKLYDAKAKGRNRVAVFGQAD